MGKPWKGDRSGKGGHEANKDDGEWMRKKMGVEGGLKKSGKKEDRLRKV
jgi:hypothetical protein